jgi:hypothetical protein
MHLDKLGSDPEWIARKVDLIRHHHADWQLCFAAEDESWRSLQRGHYRQRRELMGGSLDVVKWKQLIGQQVEAIQQWRWTMARYRLALHTKQDEESGTLEAEKRALSVYFLA